MTSDEKVNPWTFAHGLGFFNLVSWTFEKGKVKSPSSLRFPMENLKRIPSVGISHEMLAEIANGESVKTY